MAKQFLFILLVATVFLKPFSLWAIESLSDEALAEVDAQAGPVSISVEENTNTVRLYFDSYIETYLEVDQVRLGYYYKDKEDLVTRKGLNPGEIGGVANNKHKYFDPRIDAENAVGIGLYYWIDDVGDPHQRFKVDYTDYGGKVSDETFYMVEYELEKEGHRETEFVPWTDDDLYMAKYKYKLGSKWVDGAQGDNNELYNFSSSPMQNRNYLDWDVSLNNVRLGSSPANPAIINGLVIRMQYDDLSPEDGSSPRLTDIIIGTNDLQGDLLVDFRRATGFFSPKNAYRSRRKTLQQGDNGLAGTDLGQEFNITPVPVILQRDSMLMLVDHFYFGRDYRDPTNTAFMTANPDDPLSTNSHGGLFLRIGLDRSSPHFGFNLVTGYNEMVASAFEYRGEHINESMYRWWKGIQDPPNLNKYPEYLSQSPY